VSISQNFFFLCHLQLGRITLKDCPARASLMCTNKARACPSGITCILALYESYTQLLDYRILLSMVRTFLKENDAEILPVHYTWKVVEKGLKIKWVMWC
jgi:hypothetical protein